MVIPVLLVIVYEELLRLKNKMSPLSISPINVTRIVAINKVSRCIKNVSEGESFSNQFKCEDVIES